MMRKQHWIVALAVAGSFGMTGFAHAQGGGNRPNFQNMTPEQRQQALAQFQERRLRDQMTQAGFTEAAVQDPIIEFSKSLEALRAPLREKENKLRQAVDNKAGDAEVTALIADLRTSTESAKKKRDDSLKELNAKVSYSTKPRLEALLITGGLIGDETAFANGGGAFGRGGFGQGGRGQGGRGGNRNN